MAMVVLMLALVSVRATAAGAPSRSALQACVNRWNWTRMFSGYETPSQRLTVRATVRASPCSVSIDLGPLGYLAGYDAPCFATFFGSYGCAVHGIKVPAAVRKMRNATYDTGTARLALDGERTSVPKPPAWVRRHRWDDGFIFPFNGHGQVVAGIRRVRGGWFGPAVAANCGPPPQLRNGSLVVYCGAGLRCLYSRWPLRRGDLIACPAVSNNRDGLAYWVFPKP